MNFFYFSIFFVKIKVLQVYQVLLKNQHGNFFYGPKRYNGSLWENDILLIGTSFLDQGHQDATVNMQNVFHCTFLVEGN